MQVAVSKAFAAQAETAVVADPSNDQILLGGSGTFELGLVRVYSSIDGGATWASTVLRAPGRSDSCAFGDPVVGIGLDGSQYYGFLYGSCGVFFENQRRLPNISLALARRASSSAPWTIRTIAPHRSPRFDDKPALAIDTGRTSPTRGRIYAAWSLFDGAQDRIVITHSNDGGGTWSPPGRVNDKNDVVTFAGLAVGPTGTVYITWVSNGDVQLDHSADGTHFGTDLELDKAIGIPTTVRQCGFPLGSTALPAQPRRCVTPAPLVSVDNSGGPRAGTVYVTYGAAGEGGKEQDVFVAAFDPALRQLLGMPVGPRRQVNPPDGPIASDQFLPASAVDQSTGDLWVCFYDTTGDRHRIKTWYSCTASADGGMTWARPVRAASASSNETVRRATAFEYGDYQGLAVANGVAHPFWTDSRDLATRGEEIYTTVLTRADLQLP